MGVGGGGGWKKNRKAKNGTVLGSKMFFDKRGMTTKIEELMRHWWDALADETVIEGPLAGAEDVVSRF